MTAATPRPAPDLNALFADIFDDYADIRQVAENHHLSLLDLAALLDSEPVRSHLAALARLFTLRSRLLAVNARGRAIAKLSEIVLRQESNEVARRAAVNLLQLSRMLPAAPQRSRPPRAHPPGPAPDAPAPGPPPPTPPTPPPRAPGAPPRAGDPPSSPHARNPPCVGPAPPPLAQAINAPAPALATPATCPFTAGAAPPAAPPPPPARAPPARAPPAPPSRSCSAGR